MNPFLVHQRRNMNFKESEQNSNKIPVYYEQENNFSAQQQQYTQFSRVRKTETFGERASPSQQIYQNEERKSTQNQEQLPKLMLYNLSSTKDVEEWKTLNNSLKQNTHNLHDDNFYYHKLRNFNSGNSRGAEMETPGRQLINENPSLGEMNNVNIHKSELTRSPDQISPSNPITALRNQSLMRGIESSQRQPNPTADLNTLLTNYEKQRSEKIIGERGLDRKIKELKKQNVNLSDTIKDLEKEHAVKILGEKVMELLTEKEDLINTINNLNNIVSTITTRAKEREDSLCQEIEILRKFAAEHSDEKFDALTEENRQLRHELMVQKRKFADMENQYKQENQDLMHLYIDAEETKKHIIEQLNYIKQAKDRLQSQKRLDDYSKQEMPKPQQTQSLSQNTTVAAKIISTPPQKPAPSTHNPDEDFRNVLRSAVKITNPYTQENVQVKANASPMNKSPDVEPTPVIGSVEKTPKEQDDDSGYAQAINQRLQQLNVAGSENPSSNISRDEDSSISRIRQMIKNLQNFEGVDQK